MKSKFNLSVVLTLISLIMFGFVPGSSPRATATANHPIDQALLLMFSTHMRLNGEVESAMIPSDTAGSPHLTALSPQTHADIENEIDAVIDLYVTMIANLQASGNYSKDVEDELVAQMNEKVDALQAKARALEARRSRRRGFLNRFAHWLGDKAGSLVGKAMDGAAEVITIAVEEVAPKVLKAHVLGGAALNSELFRQVGREVLKKRGMNAAENFLLRLAERINNRRAAQGEAEPTLDAVAQVTQTAWAEDFMEAFEDDDESGQSGSGGDSNGGGSAGADVVVYDFTASDAFNFTSGVAGGLYWGDYWRGRSNGDSFTLSSIELEACSVHLEFNTTAMTVSGWVEGSGQENGLPAYTESGNFRVEFSDLPMTAPLEVETWIALRFSGTGSGTASISGTVQFSHRNPEGGPDTTYTLSGSASNNNPVPITIDFYIPGYTSGGHAITMNINSGGGDGVEPADGFGYGFSFSFDQSFEELMP